MVGLALAVVGLNRLLGTLESRFVSHARPHARLHARPHARRHAWMDGWTPCMDGRHGWMDGWMDAMHGWTSWMDGRMPCDAPYGHLPYSFIAYHTQYYVVPTHASSDRVLIGDCWVLAIR